MFASIVTVQSNILMAIEMTLNTAETDSLKLLVDSQFTDSGL